MRMAFRRSYEVDWSEAEHVITVPFYWYNSAACEVDGKPGADRLGPPK